MNICEKIDLLNQHGITDAEKICFIAGITRAEYNKCMSNLDKNKNLKKYKGMIKSDCIVDDKWFKYLISNKYEYPYFLQKKYIKDFLETNPQKVTFDELNEITRINRMNLTTLLIKEKLMNYLSIAKRDNPTRKQELYVRLYSLYSNAVKFDFSCSELSDLMDVVPNEIYRVNKYVNELLFEKDLNNDTRNTILQLLNSNVLRQLLKA